MSAKVTFIKSSLPITYENENRINGRIRNNSGGNAVARGLSLKFIHTGNSNTPVRRFSLPNSLPSNQLYIKPSMYSIYTNSELIKYGFKYEFVGIYVNSVNGGDKLISYAELYVKQSVIEIYNVYTHPSYRSAGYASKLLKLIKTLHPNTNLWLGVNLASGESSGTFLSKIKLYARAGFTSEVKLTNKTPAGKQMSFNFIEMKYTHNKVQTSVNVVTKTINKSSALMTANAQSQGNEHKLYKTRFHITDSYLNEVRHLLRDTPNSNSREYGGAIQFSYSGFRSSSFTFESENQVTRHIIGRGGPILANFSTYIPSTNIDNRYLITWHTHPEKCYRLSGSCVGLPSSEDIQAYLKRYLEGQDKTGINVIFSKEGVYIIRLKSKFMTAVEKERRTSRGVFIPNMSNIKKLINAVRQLQFRPNLRNNISGQNAIVAEYKRQLESIKTPSGVSIFEMNLIRYPASGGITFNSTLHSQTVNKRQQTNAA